MHLRWANCRWHLCAQQKARSALGDYSPKSMAHDLFRLWFSCDLLVRLPLCCFQAVDQGAWSSHHGSHRPDRTRSPGGFDQGNEKVRLRYSSCLDFVEIILSSVGPRVRYLDG